MEKGALLPLRFYPGTSWQDYNKISHAQDMAIFREHQNFPPAFQLTLPDIGMHWGILDFTTIDMVNIEDLSTVDITGHIFEVYSVAGEFRALVHFRYPLGSLNIGRFYYHISDGQTDWYSEVFELCDLDTNALSAVFDHETNFSQWGSTYSAAAEAIVGTFFCKTTAAGRGHAYTDITAFLEEEFDLYVTAANYGGPACGATDWNASLFLELRTATGLVVSNTIEVTAVGTYSFQLITEAGGSLRLYMYAEDDETTKGTVAVWLQRRYSEKNVQIRWSHPKNFCKIFYEDGYENVMFLNSKQVINENSIEETVVEDDETNKYRIIGTNKKFNSLRIASGEAMLNAMSLLRLHDNITIYRETGEPMDVDDITLEQSVKDYETSIIDLVYRERSCSVEACGFEICCPDEEIPIMEDVIYGGVGNLPPAANWTGKYFIVDVNPWDFFLIYNSTGAAWVGAIVTWNIIGNCLEARQNLDEVNYTPGREATRFFWYDSSSTCWRQFIDLASVTDNADGTANVVSDTEYVNGVYLQAEYENGGVWTACSTITTTVAGAGALTHVCSCGVGTFNFRFHIWTDDCDYGYSNWLPQTIT